MYEEGRGGLPKSEVMAAPLFQVDLLFFVMIFLFFFPMVREASVNLDASFCPLLAIC